MIWRMITVHHCASLHNSELNQEPHTQTRVITSYCLKPSPEHTRLTPLLAAAENTVVGQL